MSNAASFGILVFMWIYRFAFFTKLFDTPMAALLILLGSAGALGFGFVMQFGFGLEPCILCLWQRLPYAITLISSALALILPPSNRRTGILLGLCALAFASGVGLATFHTGVEQHWWLGTSSCSLRPLSGTPTVEDIRTELLHTVVARCDEVAWTFLGLSMANWNLPYSLLLMGFSGLAARKRFYV